LVFPKPPHILAVACWVSRLDRAPVGNHAGVVEYLNGIRHVVFFAGVFFTGGPMIARIAGVLVVSSAVLIIDNVSAQGKDGPRGTYAATTRNDKWTISLADNGNFTLMRKSAVMVKGTYKVLKNNQIEFDDEKNPKKEHHHKPGMYSFKLEGNKLTFTKIEDELKTRAKALTSQVWTKE